MMERERRDRFERERREVERHRREEEFRERELRERELQQRELRERERVLMDRRRDEHLRREEQLRHEGHRDRQVCCMENSNHPLSICTRPYHRTLIWNHIFAAVERPLATQYYSRSLNDPTQPCKTLHNHQHNLGCDTLLQIILRQTTDLVHWVRGSKQQSLGEGNASEEGVKQAACCCA